MGELPERLPPPLPWERSGRLAPEKAAPIRDHILRPCKHCGSKNTVCVFDDSAGSIIGYHAEEEFLCSDCGYFTAYIIHYES